MLCSHNSWHDCANRHALSFSRHGIVGDCCADTTREYSNLLYGDIRSCISWPFPEVTWDVLVLNRTAAHCAVVHIHYQDTPRTSALAGLYELGQKPYAHLYPLGEWQVVVNGQAKQQCCGQSVLVVGKLCVGVRDLQALGATFCLRGLTNC